MRGVSDAYSQHEVLFPAGIVASHGDRRRLDILQFERHVRVELVYTHTHTHTHYPHAATTRTHITRYSPVSYTHLTLPTILRV